MINNIARITRPCSRDKQTFFEKMRVKAARALDKKDPTECYKIFRLMANKRTTKSRSLKKKDDVLAIGDEEKVGPNTWLVSLLLPSSILTTILHVTPARHDPWHSHNFWQSVAEVEQCAKKKKKVGPDGISSLVLRASSDALATQMCHLIHRITQTEEFPPGKEAGQFNCTIAKLTQRTRFNLLMTELMEGSHVQKSAKN